MRSARTSGTTPAIRCAIYTRTSSSEGLARELNSLEVQRDACTSFIASQRHEDWTLVRTKYDDGGYSGGSLKRPALARLLDDVSTGEVDIAVVYKIDRLTRSLSDFARIMDILERSGASFVSVTQSFNSQTSMGRLTLNVLLSFAQFERELGSERVRDRIAAARARGLWTGGPAPLGYDNVERRLVVNPSEARTVDYIMETYARLGSITETVAILEADGIRTKSRIMGGRPHGDVTFGHGALRYLLGNRIYCGEVRGTAGWVAGQHEAIVAPALWARVEAHLLANVRNSRCGYRAAHPSLLAGMIRDGIGRRMTPVQTSRKSRRYCYYVSNEATLPAAAAGSPVAGRIWRIPAEGLEQQVRLAVAGALRDEAPSVGWIERHDAGAGMMWRDAISAAASRICEARNSDVREILLKLGLRVAVQDKHLRLNLSRAAVEALGHGGASPSAAGDEDDDDILVNVPAAVSKCGRSIRLVLLPEGAKHRNPALIRLVVEGFRAREQLLDGNTATLRVPERSRLTRLARLSYLAPDIVEAVLGGTQPVGLNATVLRRTPGVPLRWAEQRRLFGFPEPAGLS